MRFCRSPRCRRASRSHAWAWTTHATRQCWPRGSWARDAASVYRGLIERYTRPEMGAVWTDQARMDAWLQVEVAGVDALAEQGIVPAEDARAVKELAAFTVEAVLEREKVTDHDMAAFVDVVAQAVGEPGRWVHYGLTSSDVLDTALALQIRKAGEIVTAGARAFRDALKTKAL